MGPGYLWTARRTYPLLGETLPERQVSDLLAAVALLSAAIFALLTPPAEYLPEGEEPKAFASLSSPPGYNIDTMAKIGHELQDWLLPYIEHEPEQFASGETTIPALEFLNVSIEPKRIRIITVTKDPTHIKALMEAFERKYTGYQAVVRADEVVAGPPCLRQPAVRSGVLTQCDVPVNDPFVPPVVPGPGVEQGLLPPGVLRYRGQTGQKNQHSDYHYTPRNSEQHAKGPICCRQPGFGNQLCGEKIDQPTHQHGSDKQYRKSRDIPNRWRNDPVL